MIDKTRQLAINITTSKTIKEEPPSIMDQLNEWLSSSLGHDLNPHLLLKVLSGMMLSRPFLDINLKLVLKKMQVFKTSQRVQTKHKIDPLYSLYLQLQHLTATQKVSIRQVLFWLFNNYQNHSVKLTKNMIKVLDSPFLGPDTQSDQIGAPVGLTYQATTNALRSLKEKGILHLRGLISPKAFYLTPVFLLLPPNQTVYSDYIQEGTRFSGGKGATCYHFLYPTSQYAILEDTLEKNLGPWQFYGTCHRLKDTMSLYFFNNKLKRFMISRKHFDSLQHTSTGPRTLVQRPPKTKIPRTKRLSLDTHLAYFLGHDLDISNSALASLLNKTPSYISERKKRLLENKIIYPYLRLDRIGLEETVLLLSHDIDKAQELPFFNYLPRSQSFKITQSYPEQTIFLAIIQGPIGISTQIGYFLDFHVKLKDYRLFQSLSMFNQNTVYPYRFLEKTQSWQIDRISVA